jgi:hypothetical protein
VIESALAALDVSGGDTLESVHAADIEARVHARQTVRRLRETASA